jgi:hypothetical protein
MFPRIASTNALGIFAHADRHHDTTIAESELKRPSLIYHKSIEKRNEEGRRICKSGDADGCSIFCRFMQASTSLRHGSFVHNSFWRSFITWYNSFAESALPTCY